MKNDMNDDVQNFIQLVQQVLEIAGQKAVSE